MVFRIRDACRMPSSPGCWTCWVWRQPPSSGSQWFLCMRSNNSGRLSWNAFCPQWRAPITLSCNSNRREIGISCKFELLSNPLWNTCACWTRMYSTTSMFFRFWVNLFVHISQEKSLSVLILNSYRCPFEILEEGTSAMLKKLNSVSEFEFTG